MVKYIMCISIKRSTRAFQVYIKEVEQYIITVRLQRSQQKIRPNPGYFEINPPLSLAIVIAVSYRSTANALGFKNWARVFWGSLLEISVGERVKVLEKTQ